MVIETAYPDSLDKVYARFHEKGRMLPDGLYYVDSWLENDGDRCFQLMETKEPALFNVWINHWKDLTHFEVIQIGDKPEKSR